MSIAESPRGAGPLGWDTAFASSFALLGSPSAAAAEGQRHDALGGLCVSPLSAADRLPGSGGSGGSDQDQLSSRFASAMALDRGLSGGSGDGPEGRPASSVLEGGTGPFATASRLLSSMHGGASPSSEWGGRRCGEGAGCLAACLPA